MKTAFLDFEQPIAELEAKIEELRFAQEDSATDISEEIQRLQKKSAALTREIYGKLTPWQVAQVARHPQRPYTLDYAAALFSDFEELHGDRSFADDPSIVGGLARFNGQSVIVIGHQKGRDTKEKIFRNFGMPRPEGYRKAMRLMRLAERFGIPVLSFIDTPGAYPGIGAEERGQAEAIGRNLYVMAELRVPFVCTIIGEGGSGGALAIAVGDIVMMLQYATYSVISPEGCASILWKSADRAPEAAETLGITASRLKTLGLIDKIVNEPLGGAHRDPAAMAQSLKKALTDALRGLADKRPQELVEERFERLMGYGKFKELELRCVARKGGGGACAGDLPGGAPRNGSIGRRRFGGAAVCPDRAGARDALFASRGAYQSWHQPQRRALGGVLRPAVCRVSGSAPAGDRRHRSLPQSRPGGCRTAGPL